MKVKLLKPFADHPAGDVFEPDDVVGQMLIDRGAAELVKPFADDKPANRAMKPEAVKRK